MQTIIDQWKAKSEKLENQIEILTHVKMPKPLTNQQSKILTYYNIAHPKVPTIKEVAVFCNLSKTTIHEHLQNLVKFGHLVKTGNLSRNYGVPTLPEGE